MPLTTDKSQHYVVVTFYFKRPGWVVFWWYRVYLEQYHWHCDMKLTIPNAIKNTYNVVKESYFVKYNLYFYMTINHNDLAASTRWLFRICFNNDSRATCSCTCIIYIWRFQSDRLSVHTVFMSIYKFVSYKQY